MLTLKINEIGLESYLADFSFSSSVRSSQRSRNSGGFECFDGTYVSPDGRVFTPKEANAGVITLNVNLRKVPSAQAEIILTAISEGSFDVDCSAPSVSGRYTRTSCNSSSRTKGAEWDIDMVLESAAADSTSASG